MLRISVVNDTPTTRFKLEGKLAHEWVREAQRAWHALTTLQGEDSVVVDLFDVSFVDELGWQLLIEMRHDGATLQGSGPMISALIEEIEHNREMDGTSADASPKKTGSEAKR